MKMRGRSTPGSSDHVKQLEGALKAAQGRGYLVTVGDQGCLAAAWRHFCKATNQPYLRVTCTRRSAKVFMHLLFTDRALTPAAQSAITALCHLAGGNWLKCTPNFVLGTRVPTPEAAKLARLLLNIVLEFPGATSDEAA